MPPGVASETSNSRPSALYFAAAKPLAAKFSVANPQQMLPLAKVTLEAHAFGNLKSRDQASLDLLSTLP